VAADDDLRKAAAGPVVLPDVGHQTLVLLGSRDSARPYAGPPPLSRGPRASEQPGRWFSRWQPQTSPLPDLPHGDSHARNLNAQLEIESGRRGVEDDSKQGTNWKRFFGYGSSPSIRATTAIKQSLCANVKLYLVDLCIWIQWSIKIWYLNPPITSLDRDSMVHKNLVFKSSHHYSTKLYKNLSNMRMIRSTSNNSLSSLANLRLWLACISSSLHPLSSIYLVEYLNMFFWNTSLLNFI
jgi:hypothetical protein